MTVCSSAKFRELSMKLEEDFAYFQDDETTENFIEGNLNTFTDRLYSIKANLGKLAKHSFIGKQQSSLADFRTRLDKKIGELQTRMSTITNKQDHLHRQSIQVSIRIIKECIVLLDTMLSTPTATSTQKNNKEQI